MNDLEVGELLARIALVDNRDVGDGNILAWAELLPPDLSLDDALAAVREHRLNHFGVYLEPGHVISVADKIRRARLDRAGDSPIPGGLTRAQERAWHVLWCEHVKAGLDRADAALAASTDMDLPPEIPAAPETVKAGVRAIRELTAAWSIPKGETPDDRRDREKAELRARLAAEDRRKTEADHPGVIPPIDYAGLASEPRGFA